MTDQGSTMWLWTLLLGGAIWLTVAFIVGSFIGAATKLGRPEDRGGRRAH